MQHLNGKLLCVIDTETTGLDPRNNEIWQLCIMPLDNELIPSRQQMPFLITMKPEHLEYIDWNVTVMKKNKSKILDASLRGHDREAAKDLLVDWIEKLKLPLTKYGTPKKIEPLGQNYCFDKGFLEQWLGVEMYQEYFDYHYRDTMQAALYLNDRAAFHGSKVPFSKVNLKWLANKLGVELIDHHDALADCQATAEVYRRMCHKNFGVLS